MGRKKGSKNKSSSETEDTPVSAVTFNDEAAEETKASEDPTEDSVEPEVEVEEEAAKEQKKKAKPSALNKIPPKLHKFKNQGEG